MDGNPKNADGSIMCFECKSTKHLINDCPHKDKVEKVNDKVHLTLISGAEKNGQA